MLPRLLVCLLLMKESPSAVKREVAQALSCSAGGKLPRPLRKRRRDWRRISPSDRRTATKRWQARSFSHRIKSAQRGVRHLYCHRCNAHGRFPLPLLCRSRQEMAADYSGNNSVSAAWSATLSCNDFSLRAGPTPLTFRSQNVVTEQLKEADHSPSIRGLPQPLPELGRLPVRSLRRRTRSPGRAAGKVCRWRGA